MVKRTVSVKTDTPEKFSVNELGYNGERMFDGVSKSELTKELNHPHSIKTFREMSYHPSVNSALSLYDNMIQKANFKVVAVKDANKKEKRQAELVQSMLEDMDVPLSEVISDIMSMCTYGFSVMEKVYRRREKKNGSNFDDNVIGIRKIALRNQESIEKFIFDETGNEIIGVKQDLSMLHDPHQRYAQRKELSVILPKEKFMLFTVGRSRNNPYGVSPLRDVYLPWKYLTSIEEMEASGVAKDLQGVPVN